MIIIDENRCKGCGLCVEVCPAKILVLPEGRFNTKGYPPVQQTDPEACVGCAMCALVCPDVVFQVYRTKKPAQRAA
jgi:2-oxoglutarate ferredoxin oxidoreductase subunit delta